MMPFIAIPKPRNLLAGLSLVLFLASAALWVRGYWAMDGFEWRSPTAEIRLLNSHGAIGVRVLLPHRPNPKWSNRLMFVSWPPGPLAIEGQKQFLGFFYFPFQDPFWRVTRLAVPTWFVMALTAILPLWRLRGASIRRWRSRNRLCIHCGYDLRASQDQCPECGTAIPPPVRRA